MILILSVDYDHSTSNVIEWLLKINKKFDRINFEDTLFSNIKINPLTSSIQFYNQKSYDFKEYKSYWYRRGNFNLANKLFITEENILKETINKFNIEERKTVLDFIHHSLLEKKYINSYNDTFLNKISVLYEAKKIGLLIPDTIITNNKIEVIDFNKKHKNIITKPIYEGFSMQIENKNFYLHTILLSKNDIEKYPEKFPITKFQECIDKIFELRIFYLNGIFYSSAIFSQNDEKTKVDFRNYNEDKPNRVIPFKLPEGIKKMITKLMKKISLNCGSIDMIVTPNNEFVFLEVNPIGQFTQVSLSCNYHIEEFIANKL